MAKLLRPLMLIFRSPILLAALLLAPSIAVASPPILFQDRFETAPVNGGPLTPPWTNINRPHADHTLIVRQDSANLLGLGPENRYLEFRDPTSTASMLLGAYQVLSHEVVTVSFLLREPSDSGLSGQLTLQAFAGNGSASSTNRVQVFYFLNGQIAGSPNIPYGMDRPVRVDLVLNNSAQSVTYRNGSRTVASGHADIWIDGQLAAGNFTNLREAGPGPIRSFDFRTFTSQRQQVYLDNITVFEGASASAPFTPPVGEVRFPLILQPNREVDELFGYTPDFLPNEISFDRRNRPYLRSRTTDIDDTRFVQTIRDGTWLERSFIAAIRQAFPTFDHTFRGAGWLGARVVFDEEDRMYTGVKIRLTNGSYRNVLLFSTDHGATFTAHDIGTGGDVALESFTGHNRLQGPPFLTIQNRRVATHPDNWADYHEMRVVQPRIVNGTLHIPPHLHVTNDLISLGQHSGGTSFSATLDGKTHFAWIEVTDDNVPGSPTYVATYDHATNTVGTKVLVAYAPPKNNSHNRPGVVIDSEGHIHVVTGSHHGENFFHVRSLQPNNAYAGWTTPAPVWNKGWRNSSGTGPERGGQTYVSLVCDSQDTLHLAFRQWRYADQHFNRDSYYAALSYQRKPKDGPWSAPVPLVIPERGIYAIYHQKLSIDHHDRLFLSASYYDNTLAEIPGLGRYLRRMLLLSPDGGDTWQLANTEDLDDRWFLSPFELWQRRHFSPAERKLPSGSAPASAPAHDGVPNLLKAALDLPPMEPARNLLPEAFIDDAGALAIEATVSAEMAHQVTVEMSPDLVTWSAAEVERVASPVADGMQQIRFRVSPTTATGERIFLRLRLTDGE